MNGVGATSGVRDFAKLVYRLFGHPAMGTSAMAVTSASVGVALLLVSSLFAGGDSLAVVRGLGAALAFGLASTLVAGKVITSFNVYSPHYSVWMVPSLAILLGSAFRAPAVTRRLALVAWLLLIAADVYAAYRLETKGELFSHGPHRAIAELVRRGDISTTAVIHDGDAFGITYFPLRYEFAGTLAQYQASASDQPPRIARLPSQGEEVPSPIDDVHFGRLIVVRAVWQTADDIAEELRGRRRPIAAGATATALLASPHWKLTASRQFVAMAGAAIHQFERVR
jgi:hypothetical protein